MKKRFSIEALASRVQLTIVSVSCIFLAIFGIAIGCCAMIMAAWFFFVLYYFVAAILHDDLSEEENE